MRKLLFLITFLLSCITTVFAITPKDEFFVNDYIGILSEEQISEMVGSAAMLQEQNGVQVVAVIVEHYTGESINMYANQVFNDFGIGQSDANNGLMLIVAYADGAVRIEVGIGMEQYLSESQAGRLIDDYFMPKAENDDIAGAIQDTFSQLLQVGRRAETSGVPRNIESSQNTETINNTMNNSNISTIFFMVAILFIVIIIFSTIGTRTHRIPRRRRMFRPMWFPMFPPRSPRPPIQRPPTTFGGGISRGGGASRNFSGGNSSGSFKPNGKHSGGGGTSRGGGASRSFSGGSSSGSFKSGGKRSGGGGMSRGGGASRSFKK